MCTLYTQFIILCCMHRWHVCYNSVFWQAANFFEHTLALHANVNHWCDLVECDWTSQEHARSGRQLIGCFAAASNVTGVLTDTNSITAVLHRHGALVFWDYATAGLLMSDVLIELQLFLEITWFPCRLLLGRCYVWYMQLCLQFLEITLLSIHPPIHPSIHPSTHLPTYSRVFLFLSVQRRYVSLSVVIDGRISLPTVQWSFLCIPNHTVFSFFVPGPYVEINMNPLVLK